MELRPGLRSQLDEVLTKKNGEKALGLVNFYVNNRTELEEFTKLNKGWIKLMQLRLCVAVALIMTPLPDSAESYANRLKNKV